MAGTIGLASSFYLFRPPFFEALSPNDNHRNHENLVSLFSAFDRFDWLEASRIAKELQHRNFGHLQSLFEDETNRRISLATDEAYWDMLGNLAATLGAHNLSKQEWAEVADSQNLKALTREQAILFSSNESYRTDFIELQRAKARLHHADASPSWPIKTVTLSIYGGILARAAVYSGLLGSMPTLSDAASSIQTMCRAEQVRNHEFLIEAKAAFALTKLQILADNCSTFRNAALRNIDRYANLICLCQAIWIASSEGTVAERKEAHGLMLHLAQAIRESISLLCLSVRFTQLSSLPVWAEEIEVWIDAAQKLPVPSNVEDGVNVTHGQLESDWDSFEGRLIELDGMVTNSRILVETTSGPNKTTSFFTCQEISADRDEIEVAFPYSNLPSQGLVDGVPVRLSGVPYVGQDGQRRIRLDTHSYSELKKNSFYDFCQNDIGDLFPVWFLRRNLLLGYLAGTEGALGTGVKEVGLILVGDNP